MNVLVFAELSHELARMRARIVELERDARAEDRYAAQRSGLSRTRGIMAKRALVRRGVNVHDYYSQLGSRGGLASRDARRRRKALALALAEHPELARLEALRARSRVRDAPRVW